VKATPSKIPVHVAIIMDGNGRWAQRRGLPRIKGHVARTDSVRAIVRACRKAGVKYLTLYAFSSENWVRPKAEIIGLMRILRRFLTQQEHELHENKVRLRVIGHIDDLPLPVQRELRRVIEVTKDYKEGTLTLALSYGGRVEITDAARKIAEDVRAGKLKPSAIDERKFAEYLYAPDVPDPDLMIRTSGELRLSNFLLWQLSYAEFYITDVLWPDFREKEFEAALQAYAERRRRYGDVK